MKVGDYVRTKIFGIRKITFIDEIALECGEYSFETDISIPGFCDFSGEDIIGKPSPNIIDLIEVGDVIKFEYNGVEYICDVYDLGNANYLVVYCEDTTIPVKTTNKSVELKSIVTKEQFSQMEYRIGD